MPKLAYENKKFRADSLRLIEQANAIIGTYMAQGYDLTLRQIYYQFVARGIIANNERSYKNLGAIINDARLAGLIDWEHIQDRTRNLRANGHWDSPAEIIQGCAYSFRLDKWSSQDYRVEVWIEKDALVGVIADVCRRLDVPYFSCRGYTSQSEMWAAAQRLIGYQGRGRYGLDSKTNGRHGKTPVILHLGDHDPSGIDMSRDIEDRLRAFTLGGRFEFRRLALNMDQIRQYNPPPNPAKLTDSRITDYMAEHGDESWELDALEPSVITALVEEAVLSYRDEDRWEAAAEDEQRGRDSLTAIATNYPAVQRWITEQGKK